MLLGAGRHRGEVISAQDSVHNYYEHLVIGQLLRASDRANEDAEFLADVSCVALNRLPPRYVRHDVDMTFFLSPAEMEEIDNKVALAVNEALEYVLSREAERATRGADSDDEVDTPVGSTDSIPETIGNQENTQAAKS